MSRANEPAGGRQREGVSTGRQRLWAEDGVNEEDGAKVLANAPEPDETAEVRGFYDGDSDDGYAGVRDDMISQVGVHAPRNR